MSSTEDTRTWCAMFVRFEDMSNGERGMGVDLDGPRRETTRRAGLMGRTTEGMGRTSFRYIVYLYAMDHSKPDAASVCGTDGWERTPGRGKKRLR
jgi:hypothetical protein